MQHNSPHIILTSRPMIWRLSFKYEDIYSIASVETGYADQRNNEPDGTEAVLMDDDKPIFNRAKGKLSINSEEFPMGDAVRHNLADNANNVSIVNFLKFDKESTKHVIC